eukprot:1187583-Prorocentrum_minimum.AAC.1
MAVLKELRDRESEIDNVMVPIEEIYNLLGRYEVKVAKEETDMVGDLQYAWKKLRNLATSVSDKLSKLQVGLEQCARSFTSQVTQSVAQSVAQSVTRVGFKRELIKEVKLFIVDVVNFRQDFDANGPMVEGLDPMEAVDRLKKFQQLFDVRKRKWVNYSSGEELFGLTVTQYPELEKTEQEIQMLDRLYSLFVNVITTINGYGEFFWVDVLTQIDTMSEQVAQFQAQCKKLPKSLRGWAAFRDLKKKIDDFLEILPLIQALCSKSMRQRHWQEVMTVTGKTFNLSEDVFKLQHLLDADLLARYEELEELTSAAVKEEQARCVGRCYAGGGEAGRHRGGLAGPELRVRQLQAPRQRAPARVGDGGDCGEAGGHADGAGVHGHQPLLGAVPRGGAGVDRQAVDGERDHRDVAGGAEHVVLHGGGVLRGRHRQAAAAGGEALPVHRQELHEGRLKRKTR